MIATPILPGLSPVACKSLTATFDAGRLSSDGGLVVLREIATRLMNLQAADGSWVNDTARWMEKDPVLVTSYGVMTLEIIYNRL